jgi:hypothetical protein
MKRGHYLALLAAAAIIAGVLLQMMKTSKTGGFTQPQKQPRPDDDLGRLVDPHPDHPLFCQPHQHHSGYTYTPHRYPRVTGGEITAAIHGGFSSMRVPNVADVQWLIAPPSEVMF